MSATWPVAELDNVARLRVLAVAQRSAMFVDDVVAASFEEVWAVASDLENELSTLLADVRSLEITSADGERLTAFARGYGPLQAEFDIVLRPGWCVMQSRFLLGGMAAVPAGEGRTHFAFLGGFRFPGVGLLRPVLGPLGRKLGPVVIRRLRNRLGVT